MTPQIERPCPRPNVRETAAAFADDAADELSADGPAMMEWYSMTALRT